MQLICQKYPDTLKNEAKVFFVKYNDPIYVKMEKLEVLVMLAHAGKLRTQPAPRMFEPYTQSSKSRTVVVVTPGHARARRQC
jgi:vesicle coat complex subunit